MLKYAQIIPRLYQVWVSQVVCENILLVSVPASVGD